jgi:nucleoside-diphosphate-sugar epimerase
VYARTKLEAEQQLAHLAAEYGVPMLTVRVFGLIAPKQAANYVLHSLIARVHEENVQEVPGLEYVRDYLDARDVCESLLHLSAANWPASDCTVNLCSGVPVAIRDLLGVVLNIMEPDRAEGVLKSIRAAPGRPDDVAWLVGDPRRYVEMTGESPQHIPLADSVRDAVDAYEAS